MRNLVFKKLGFPKAADQPVNLVQQNVEVLARAISAEIQTLSQKAEACERLPFNDNTQVAVLPISMGGAGTVTVAHGLGAIPDGWMITTLLDAAATCYASVRSVDATNITVGCSRTTATLTLIVWRA